MNKRGKPNVLCGSPLIRHTWWFMHDYRNFEFRAKDFSNCAVPHLCAPSLSRRQRCCRAASPLCVAS